MILQRVRASWRHKPWTIDVLSAVVTFAYGVFVFYDPGGLTVPAYDFLDNVDPNCIAIPMMALGAFQFIATQLNSIWMRRIAAFLTLWNWCGLVWGINQSDPHSLAQVAYGGYALANLVTIIRV